MDRSTVILVDGLGAAAGTSGSLRRDRDLAERAPRAAPGRHPLARSLDRHGGSPNRIDGGHPSAIVDVGLRLLKPHARARVWEEERHRYLPAWSLRHFYRLLIPPIASLSAHGSRRSRTAPAPP